MCGLILRLGRCTGYFLCFCLPAICWGQGEAHLYLFNLLKTPDQTYHVFGPKYLSGFNPGGYTNQPAFTPAGELLVSVRKKGEKQNDIWLLSPGTHKCRQITKTKASEFSPQIQPGGTRYSVVRQVEGEPIDQQVYSFPMHQGAYESTTPGIKDIGYYAWLSEEELALYRLDGESNRLMSYDLKDQRTKRITSSIGRTLLADGKGGLYYIHKFSETYWYLKKYDEHSTMIDVIVETPAKSEDFTRAPDGTFFMGQDSKLMYYTPGDQATWKEVGDLAAYGIQHISRMAVSPDGKQLAIVAIKE